MPLRRLSCELIELGQTCATTPVFVIPAWLSLRAEFYAEIAKMITSQTEQHVRFDKLSPVGGLWQTLINQANAWQVARINRKLIRLSRPSIATNVVLTASIARPVSTDRKENDHHDALRTTASNVFVIGIANDSVSLPNWTTPIHLADSPSGAAALHS